MSTKDYAMSILDSLSEEKLRAFITLFADDNTIARIETEMLANDPDAPQYRTVEELMEDLHNG